MQLKEEMQKLEDHKITTNEMEGTAPVAQQSSSAEKPETNLKPAPGLSMADFAALLRNMPETGEVGRKGSETKVDPKVKTIFRLQ